MLMSTTIAVALITSLSTLAGAGISGLIAFLIDRTRSSAQLTLANTGRVDERLKERRQIRRDAYVQFLNQVSSAEEALEAGWLLKPPPDSTDAPGLVAPVTAELHRLQRLANLVALEGPNEVTLAAQGLQVRLTLESVDMVDVAKIAEKDQALCLHDEDRFMKVKMDRTKAKSKMIKAAQEALDDRSLQVNETHIDRA